jgi:hypothetical protein
MSSSPLSSPPLFLPSRSPSPLVFQIDPDYDYNKEERLQIAIAHYDTQKKNYAQGKGKKPNLLRLSKLYEVKESTMRYHIKNPAAKSNVVVQSKNTLAQENKLIARCFFMDDFNLLADQLQVEHFALALVQQANPTLSKIGAHWFRQFLK